MFFISMEKKHWSKKFNKINKKLNRKDRLIVISHALKMFLLIRAFEKKIQI